MLLTVKQAVKHLGGAVGEYMIYDMVRRDQIPTIKLVGRKILFNSERLDEWIANDCIMKDEWKRDKQEVRPASYGKLRQIIP
jgi:excisionase family DNA binding protein